MKIKVETEQKYYCFNPEKLIEKINELGFNELNKKSESDEYFTDINSEYIANRTCLRIRKTNNSKMEITFKGKSSSLLGKYCKLENNISADIGEYENFVNLFTSLGFYSYCEVIKERLTFEKYDDKYKYSIMIDSLPNIGGFVEFEILSEQEDSTKYELNIALKKFVNAFVDLNLKEETRPYRDVVADYIYSKNCPKDKLEDIYVNIDEFIVNYEKEFFKKYKDVIAKETNKSIESQDSISLFNSPNMLGSCPDPVNNELCDNGVTGLVAFLLFNALLLFTFEYKAVSISPFLSISYFLISSSFPPETLFTDWISTTCPASTIDVNIVYLLAFYTHTNCSFFLLQYGKRTQTFPFWE